MRLDKWASNDLSLLPPDSTSSTSLHSFAEPHVVSTLGLHWNSTDDFFCFKVTLTPVPGNVTKRTMLSEAAKLFDPLGWLAPVVVAAKILIQRLWIKKYGWDEPVDDETRTAWLQLRQELPVLEDLRIPRWLGAYSTSKFTLHGFADASHAAYAASIYLVTGEDEGRPSATLLMAKTKLASIKTVSIPRLELSAALLLTRLLKQAADQLQREPAAIYCWSDSKVTLAWLADYPSRWNTFIANRVSEILTTLPQARWNHVRSAENSADIASRGLLPSKLSSHQLWWQGPSWLRSGPSHWPTPIGNVSTELEERRDVLTFVSKDEHSEKPSETLLSRFSSLTRLIRVISYALRWKQLATSKDDAKGHQSSTLSADELRQAGGTLIRAVQRDYYNDELRCLANDRNLPVTSSIRHFRPFIGDDGVLRIGGRLQNAFLSEDEKHPAIIPNESHLAELLIRDAHHRTLHGGPQLVTSYLQRSTWIVRARNRIRRLTKQCVRCTRFQGQRQTQQMAPMPSVRVTPTRTFTSTGIDYAGPLLLRTSKGRGHKAYKGYLAVFICMVTRAVHLEVVSDYTTQGFLLAFRRFPARRGLCATIYSDNGTTFKGASAEIRRLFDATSSTGRETAATIAADGVDWKFIPPRAPHFGGLWEAGVKSAKHHLRRVLGEATLTYEEFATLVAQIEACLNSRPLCPLSTDPTDVAALTPGHFLIGAPLTALPEPPLLDFNVAGLPRYRLTSTMQAHFWKRWQREVLLQYLHQSKWLQSNREIQEGDLVLLTDELQLSTKWPLARVERCHPGPDGLIRVLTLRTSNTTLTRPLVKVIRLPIHATADSHTVGGFDPSMMASRTAGGPASTTAAIPTSAATSS